MKSYRTVGRGNRGFTLVEILIVVIILGILAAIVIPQFTNASTEARRNSLTSQLQTIRSQVELFKLQHGDALPDLVGGWNPLTATSTFGGQTFGPYMQSAPTNPLVDSAVNIAVKNGTSASTPDATTAYLYDYSSGAGTGKIWAVEKSGTTYSVFAE